MIIGGSDQTGADTLRSVYTEQFTVGRGKL
jgi:hypothetical protein